ncbi:phage tail tip lysozyme [Asaia astilbis]|uniref:phage tail tip lysozyme n=1 Tax=Asaia astilbis TaxID=610244 RepID=UPI0004703D69|nr:phage tail tip lysozyme [Asaia astilbis]
MSLIDSLVIQLKLDAKGFSPEANKTVQQLKDVEKQANSTGNGIEKSGGKGAAALSSVRREALAMFAVFTAGKGLKQFVGDTTKANAQLDYMSKRLNMDPATLTRMETAAKAAGGSFGEMSQAFSNLQQRMTNPEEAAKIALTFSRLQVPDFTDEAGNIKSDIVERLNKSIHDNKIDPRIATSWLKDLGFGDGAINEALMDPKKFADLQKQIKGMAAPTKEMTEAARHLNQEWVIFSEQSQQLASMFTSKLDPALDGFLQKLIGLEKEYPNTTGALAVVAGGVEELTKSFGGLIGVLGSLSALRIVKRMFGGGGTAKAGGLLGRTAEGLAGLGEKGALTGALALGGEATASLAGFSALPAAAGAFAAYRGYQENKASQDEIDRSRSEASNHADERRKYLYSRLVKSGFSRNAALGVVGGIDKESGFNPLARGDVGSFGATAFGIGQWHKARVEDILKGTGIDVRSASFKDQSDALVWELTKGGDALAKKAGDALKDPSISLSQSAHAFRKLYERPKDADGTEDASRLALSLRAASAIQDGYENQAPKDLAPAVTQAAQTFNVKHDYSKHWAGAGILSKWLNPRNYAIPGQKDQTSEAIAAIRAMREQDPQSILRNDHAQVASSVSAGAGPTSNDNSTTNNTSSSVNLYGPINIDGRNSDGDGMARQLLGGLRNQVNARSITGVQ